MSERFRDVSPEDAELQPIIEGLFGEYAARYGDYFSKDAEVELTEWYLAPQGLFIVLERDGKIIATGAYKPFDERTAEIKRIWTDKSLRQQGLAARVVQELRNKGLDDDTVRAATAQLRATEHARAWAVWQQKFGQPPATPQERMKQMRFLASRGFGGEVVSKVVKGQPPESEHG